MNPATTGPAMLAMRCGWLLKPRRQGCWAAQGRPASRSQAAGARDYRPPQLQRGPGRRSIDPRPVFRAGARSASSRHPMSMSEEEYRQQAEALWRDYAEAQRWIEERCRRRKNWRASHRMACA